MSTGGIFACFERGGTSHFRKYWAGSLAKIEKYKDNRKGGKKGGNGNQKWKKGGAGDAGC